MRNPTLGVRSATVKAQNLTGSPDYGARVRVVGDPGKGCSSDPYRQFNVEAFQGPLVGSDGLESGNGYLRGCFINVLDLAIARNIRLGAARNLQLRVDMLNAPNAAGVIGRKTTLSLASPTDPVTATNLPFDANGNLVDSRSRPRGAGFGVANNYQNPRNGPGADSVFFLNAAGPHPRGYKRLQLLTRL